MNTRPFDLEAAKRGEAICSTTGHPYRFVAYVPECKDSPIWCVESNGDIVCFTDTGIWEYKTGSEHDLRMVVKTKTVWVNLYDETGAWTVIGRRFVSEESAKAHVIDWAINGREFLGTVSIQEAA